MNPIGAMIESPHIAVAMIAWVIVFVEAGR